MPAYAATGRSFASEQISQRYEIPITDPTTGVTYQSVVQVSSAHLDTRHGSDAPKGSIFLTLSWSSVNRTGFDGDSQLVSSTSEVSLMVAS